MITRNKVLGMGLAALMAVGMIAAPSIANAQSWRYRSRTHSEDTARNNALALGAAGLLLLGNHQSTLGTIALGAAGYEAVQMQNDIQRRHDRYGYYQGGRYYGYSNNGYGYNGYGYNSYGYNGYSRRDDDDDRDDYRRDRDDQRSHRGRDWAATRGEKRGWDHNGKRERD